MPRAILDAWALFSLGLTRPLRTNNSKKQNRDGACQNSGLERIYAKPKNPHQICQDKKGKGVLKNYPFASYAKNPKTIRFYFLRLRQSGQQEGEASLWG
jgi:hypothetical protein